MFTRGRDAGVYTWEGCWCLHVEGILVFTRGRDTGVYAWEGCWCLHVGGMLVFTRGRDTGVYTWEGCCFLHVGGMLVFTSHAQWCDIHKGLAIHQFNTGLFFVVKVKYFEPNVASNRTWRITFTCSIHFVYTHSSVRLRERSTVTEEGRTQHSLTNKMEGDSENLCSQRVTSVDRREEGNSFI